MIDDNRLNPADHTHPIIVCGTARSGTTFTGALIDAHVEIAMTGEFFLYKLPSALSIFDEVYDHFGKRLTSEEWALHRARLMRALWFSASLECQAVKGRTARRFANKTPGAEVYFAFYDHVFAVKPPRWVYVLREGRKVFISRKNMQWGSMPRIEGQVKRYLESLALYEAYQRQAPDRIFLFQLDRLAADPPARLAACEQLMAFLGEAMTPEVRDFVTKWPVVNAAARHSVPGDPPLVTELLPEEQAYLDQHAKYQAAMRHYGYRD